MPGLRRLKGNGRGLAPSLDIRDIRPPSEKSTFSTSQGFGEDDETGL